MPKQEFADISCSIARAVDVIGQRWTPLIVRDLFAGMTKFEDIRRDLGIASNILATRLDDLERHGVVENANTRACLRATNMCSPKRAATSIR